MNTMHARVLLLVGVLSIGVALTKGERTSSFKSPCGTAPQLARRGGDCLKPVFDLLEGNYPVPNSGDADIQSACGRFNETSRCVRQMAKDCVTGLHKTAVGAIASATRRFYMSECKSAQVRAQYIQPIKCAHSSVNGAKIKKIYEEQTGVMQGVRDLPIPPEEKILKMCCVLDHIDEEIRKVYNKNCPEATEIVIRMVHSITDDAKNTLCLNPKCKGALDKVKNNKYKPPQRFIEPVQEILFQLNV